MPLMSRKQADCVGHMIRRPEEPNSMDEEIKKDRSPGGRMG
jgi:hypothetical protein